MSTHEEFPELTQQAQAAYRAGCLSASFSATPPARTDRRYLAAFLRQVIEGAGIWKINNEFPRVIVVENLEAIANNLHALPPPPPTREQMEDALQNLLRHTDDPAGCHEGSVVAESVDTLQRGIAHHCKVQP